MLTSGCYENVFQTSGVLQQFISRCVVGGRVMTNSNKTYHVNKRTADFDAMFLRLGFLIGLPEVLTDLSYDFLKKKLGRIFHSG